jgi:hypothetical protein
LPEVVKELTEPFVKSTLIDFPKAVSGEQEAGRSSAQIAVAEGFGLTCQRIAGGIGLSRC